MLANEKGRKAERSEGDSVEPSAGGWRRHFGRAGPNLALPRSVKLREWMLGWFFLSYGE